MPSREIHTCFVTGGTGFIGSHLVEYLLNRGCTVRCLVRDRSRLRWLQEKPVTVLQGELGDRHVVQEAASGTDAVFHLAGVTAAGSREEYLEVNARGCRRVAEAALSSENPPGVFMYLSSLAAAGPGRADEIITENRIPCPVSEYGRSKLEGERVLRAMESLPLITVRPPAVYGPRDREIFPLFKMASRGIFPVMNPASRMSFIHVGDLVKGLLVSACLGRTGETYFLAHGVPVNAVDLPRLFGAALGKRVKAVRIPRPALTAAAAVSELRGRLTGRMPVFNLEKAKELTAEGWVCGWEKARDDMGFTAETGLEEGLKNAAAWYREMGWL